MNRTSKIPQLRFPGFSGEWEEKRLGDVAEIIDGDRGVNYPKQDDFIQDQDGYCLFLSAKNVTKYGFAFEETQFISKTKDAELRKGKLKRHDIILTTRGTVGNFAYFDDTIAYDNIRLNSGMVIIRNKSINETKYYFKYFYSNYFTRQVKKILFGSAQPQLTIKEIRKFFISIPTLPEQQKIADFLSDIDTKIEKLSRKKELMTEYKKGVMQKMFSQEIRFKDQNRNDYPDWQEKRLGDLVKIQGGFAFKSENYKTTGIPVIRISNISNDHNYIESNNIVYYQTLENDNVFSIAKGDLIIAMSGATTGKTSIYNLDRKGYLNQRVGLFKTISTELNYAYLVQFVFSKKFSGQLTSRLVAGAQPNISPSDIESVEIEIPVFSEQKKIAEFLTSLDKKIEQYSGSHNLDSLLVFGV